MIGGGPTVGPGREVLLAMLKPYMCISQPVRYWYVF